MKRFYQLGGIPVEGIMKQLVKDAGKKEEDFDFQEMMREKRVLVQKRKEIVGQVGIIQPVVDLVKKHYLEKKPYSLCH